MPFAKKQIHSIRPLFSIPGIIFCMLFLSGCGMLSPQMDPILSTRALEIADRIRSVNQDIQSCKGTGWLYLRNGSRKETFRLAFAARPPDRIRLTLLASGHPVETVLADGQKVTLISHTGQHKTATYSVKNPSLEKFFSIPVNMSDIIQLLSGQIPVREFNRAGFISETDETVLIKLRKNNFSNKQLLAIEAGKSPSMLRRLDAGGNPLFTVYFNQFTRFESRIIAANFSIQDESGRTAEIVITSFQPDIPVNDAIFRLTERR